MEHALRVAAYCRVSTDKEDQLHSLAAQQAYFEGYIARHGWRCAGIFADGSSIVGLSQKELEKQAFFDLVQLFFHFTTLTKERMWNMGNLIAVTNFEGRRREDDNHAQSGGGIVRCGQKGFACRQ